MTYRCRRCFFIMNLQDLKEDSMKICQSCGMPMNDPTLFGKNTDGSVNEEYCIYCYPKGGFITPMKPLKKWLKLAFHL